MDIWVTPLSCAKYSQKELTSKSPNEKEADSQCPLEVRISTQEDTRLDLSSGLELITQKVEYSGRDSFTSVSRVVNLEDRSIFTFHAHACPRKIEFVFPVCKDSVFPALLGNDLSLYNLFFGASLTFRGSAFVLQDQLFVICGYSGSGKSTALRLVKNSLTEKCIPISDDHIHIHFEKDRFTFVAPIWDPLITHGLQSVPMSAREISFVVFSDRVNDFEIDQFDSTNRGIEILFPHIVWAGRDNAATLKILEKLPLLLAHASVNVIHPRNYSYFNSLVETYKL